MADFLSRLVERTFGLIQVAEPVITPSFAAEPASNMEYTESSVFDIKHGPDHGVSRPEAPFLPRSITQPVKHPGYNAGIKEDGTVANNRAENSPFEVTGTQVISGHEQSGFDLTPGTISEKAGFGRDMTDVTQQLPEDATWKNEKTVNHPQPMIHEMTGDDEPGFTQDIHAENAKSGDKTVYHPQRLIHEMTGDDEPVFARDIHVEHAKNGDKTVYHPQSRPMISETPVNEENSPESRRAEIMAAEKKILYQPERSLNITGTPDDEVFGNLKKAYTENMKTLKDTTGVFQVQPERIFHEPQTDSADPGNLQKPGDKYQRIETGNQSEFQVAASGEIPEMINLTDSAEKKSVKQDSDLQSEKSLPDRKMFQTSESYISTQKRREIQGSLVSTTIAGTPVSKRKLYQNSSASSNRNPPEKHIAESHSTNPAIKVTIGHVEVRAATKTAQVSVPSRQNPVLSLNDYLKKRNGNTL